MRLPRTAAILVLLALWAALAAWQYHEYRHEADTARATLRRQADAVQNALVGGIRSHRRLGPFFEEQILRVLEDPSERARLAKAGRARVLSHHTWPSAMHRLDHSIERCISAFEVKEKSRVLREGHVTS